MKKFSSSLDPQLKYNGQEPNQTSFANMARRTTPQSRLNQQQQQQTFMDQRVVRQDLLFSSDGIFFFLISEWN